MAQPQHWNKTECIFDKLDSPPMILFVELESWESDELASLCPSKCKVITSSDRLESLPNKDIPSEISIFSPFIHSRIDATQLGRMSNLKLIASRSTGFDHIDMAECSRRGILLGYENPRIVWFHPPINHCQPVPTSANQCRRALQWRCIQPRSAATVLPNRRV